MYSAIYLPSSSKNRSKGGFATLDEAEEFVCTQMCADCREERRMALAGEDDPMEDDEYATPSEYPACFHEWLIGLTAEIEAANNYEELMAAGGWEPIYRKKE